MMQFRLHIEDLGGIKPAVPLACRGIRWHGRSSRGDEAEYAEVHWRRRSMDTVRYTKVRIFNEQASPKNYIGTTYHLFFPASVAYVHKAYPRDRDKTLYGLDRIH
jgi:hypothetical protein